MATYIKTSSQLGDSPGRRKRQEEDLFSDDSSNQQSQKRRYNEVQRPVILDVNDVVSFSKEVDQKKEKISQLKNKIHTIQKKLTSSESDKEKIIQQKEETEKKNQELERLLFQERKQNDKLREQMSELQYKCETITKYVPLSNVFTSLALWKKAVEDRRVIEGLKLNCSEKEAKISQVNSDLAKSLENCGVLYNQKAELETEVSGLHKKLGTQDFSFNELKRRLFYSSALALKLSLRTPGNVSVQDLYEEAQELSVPFEQWDRWLSSKMVVE